MICDGSSNVFLFAQLGEHCGRSKICLPRGQNVCCQIQKHFMTFDFLRKNCFLENRWGGEKQSSLCFIAGPCKNTVCLTAFFSTLSSCEAYNHFNQILVKCICLSPIFSCVIVNFSKRWMCGKLIGANWNLVPQERDYFMSGPGYATPSACALIRPYVPWCHQYFTTKLYLFIYFLKSKLISTLTILQFWRKKNCILLEITVMYR